MVLGETLGETLAHQARLNPGGEALVCGAARLTWGALNARTNRLANALLALGARRGDRVLLLLGNGIVFVEAYYALAKIGCISAPVVPRSLAADVAAIAASLRPRFVIAEAGAARLLAEIGDGLASVEAAIGVGPGHGLPVDYDTITAEAAAGEPGAAVAPDDLLTVKFTSGTTGTAKGCLRSHRNFVMAALVTCLELPLGERDSALIATPLAAGMGISQVTMLILKGVRIVLMEKFEPGAWLELVERERPTLGYLMDLLARRIYAHPRFAEADLASLRLVHGLQARDVLDRWLGQPSFRAELSFGFASSECGGLVTIKTPEDYRRGLADPRLAHLLDSSGREAPLCRVACLDDELQPVATGEVGELAVRAPSVFRGYWERPEETAQTLRGGWLLTGDLAHQDEAGYVYLRGRKRDMIKSGGISVYPAEIEPVLLAHPKVREVAVVGLPDPDWGERVVACVVPREPCAEAELIAWCEGRLAPFKRPKSVAFFEALPVNEAGKIVKTEIVRRLARDGCR